MELVTGLGRNKRSETFSNVQINAFNKFLMRISDGAVVMLVIIYAKQ